MSDSIEIAKRRYSEELAAYTLEQWRLARTALEATESSSDSIADSDGSASPTEERRRSRSAKTQSQVDECTRALRSVDFASKPHKAPLVSGAA